MEQREPMIGFKRLTDYESDALTIAPRRRSNLEIFKYYQFVLRVSIGIQSSDPTRTSWCTLGLLGSRHYCLWYNLP